MNDKTCKIVIIGTYWGKFPTIFPQWLLSCEYNTTIDFLIVTDNIYPKLPPNVRFLKMTLQEFKELAESKLGMKIKLPTAYKVCDLRPCYGHIFDDLLEGYDFWGHCDFDMIFGDIRSFCEINHITKYDKFLPLGHLSLYRNSDECNNRYKLPVNGELLYLKAFECEDNCVFDEIGMRQIYHEYAFPWFEDRAFIDIAIYRRRFIGGGIYNAKHQLFGWKNGKVFQIYWDDRYKHASEQEYVYIHFQRRQMDVHLNKARQNFWITREGLYPWEEKEPINVALIEKYNPYPGKFVEWYELQERKVRILLYKAILKTFKKVGINKQKYAINILGKINPYWGPKVEMKKNRKV